MPPKYYRPGADWAPASNPFGDEDGAAAGGEEVGKRDDQAATVPEFGGASSSGCVCVHPSARC